MRKPTKLVLALVLVLIVVMVAAPAAHAASNGWAWQQEIAHQIAELARTLGLPETHPLIVICQDVWWAYHDGSDVNKIGSYTSNRTGQTYGYNQNGINYWLGKDLSTGLTYRYSGYTWYQSKTNYEYFRVETTNGVNKLVWATKSQSTSIPEYGSWVSNTQYPADGYYYNPADASSTGGGQSGGGSSNLAGYDYSYSGKQLYAGVITGLDNYASVPADKALLLAKFLGSSVAAETSQTKQAALAWSVLYLFQGPNGITEQGLKDTYSWYKSDASTIDDAGRDLLALAKDVMFRYSAWKNGNSYVGRVLPDNYTWTYYYGSSKNITGIRSSNGGADYTFDKAWSSTKDVLHSPYTT